MKKYILSITVVLQLVPAAPGATLWFRNTDSRSAPSGSRLPAAGGVAQAPALREEDDESWNLFGVRPVRAAAVDLKFREGHRTFERILPNISGSSVDDRFRLKGASSSKSSCKAVPYAGWVGVGAYLFLWAAVAVAVEARKSVVQPAKSTVLQASEQRDPRWDRVRFHLMTVIIWTHWVGKWGMEKTKAGWVVLNWGFAIHVVSFVFLSGVFSARYAKRVQTRGLQECIHVVWNCLDVLLVYLIFSWLRGFVSLTMMQPDLGAAGIIAEVMRGTFLFHQAPWYLSALIVWRLSIFILWRVPGVLVVSLVIGAFCPYNALTSVRDPFALREVMHYLPFFSLGLLCGQERLEQAITFAGKRLTPLVGLIALVALALVISIPVGSLFEDHRLRWVLLKKDVPPIDIGGYWLMLLLYVVKAASLLAALMLFSASGVPALDRAIESAGTRSMMVYMVHMVFVMVPGEWLCPARTLHAGQSGGVVSIVLLLVLAFAVNLLCGSDFTSWMFQPLMEPLATVGVVRQRVREWVGGERLAC